MRYLTTATAVLCAMALAASPAWAKEDINKQEKAQKQREVREMCTNTLNMLYKDKPELKKSIQNAAGYGCFDSFGVALVVGGAGGTGLVHDNKTGKSTYMSMGQGSVGIELGVKDYREVLVFRDAATLKKFVDSGWEFSSNAEVTGKQDDKGVQKQATGTSEYNTIDIYPMTQTGVAAGVSVGGRKYWKNDDLN